jgi:transglutaminase-like putative cysteine protease
VTRVVQLLRPIVAAVLLYALAALFSIWHLRQLEAPPLDGLFGWAALAALPAVLAVLPGRRRAGLRFAILLLPTAVLAVGRATGHWPGRPHPLGSTGYLARVGSAIGDGLDRWVHTVLPYDPTRYPELRVIVLLGVFGVFAALAASIIVFRAPFPAIVIAFIPFLVVSTVYDLGGQTERAAFMLALALLFIGVLTPRTRRTGQVAIGVTVLLTGVIVAALPGVAKSEFIDWKHWGRDVPKGQSVEYVWNQTYGPLVRPANPVTLLRIGTNGPRAYWRTIVLNRFDGSGWFQDPQPVASVPPENLVVPPEALPPGWTAKGRPSYRAQVRNVGLKTSWLVAPGVATGVFGLSRSIEDVQLQAESTFALARDLPVGSRYAVDFSPPTATVKDLRGLPVSIPNDADLALFDGALQPPEWGAAGRERQVDDYLASLGDPATVRWSEAYRKARQIVAGATTPYTAVIALEHYFHETGVYDERANYRGARGGALPTFFLQANPSGYCQMFSGTMTVLLRLLGIPARVVEGFAPGRRDPATGVYVVRDSDAHAWVEVYFEGHGWLPFEPTPSQNLIDAYSATSPRFRASAGGDLAASAVPTSLRGYLRSLGTGAPRDDRLNPRTNRGTNAGTAGDAVATGSKGFRLTFVTALVLLVVGLVVLLLLAKRVRRLPIYLRRDPQVVAKAVRADLEAFVIDQGVGGDIRALTAEEFARMLRREFGVDAGTWATEMGRARYGPRDARATRAAERARHAARDVRRDLRRELSRGDRVRGAVRIRSLLP